MPKNKGKYKSREAESATAVEPAVQLQQTLVHAGEGVRPYAKPLIIVGVLGLATLIGVLTWRWWDERREAKATSGFHQAMQVASAQIVDGELPPLDLPGMDPDAPKFKTVEERQVATLTALEKIEKEQGSSDVAKHTKLARAAVLYDMGRWDEAAAAYKSAAGSGALRFVAREGVGLALEAKALAEKDAAARTAGLDAALAEYKQLQPDEKGFYRDYALFHQGRILQLKGDAAGAKALYKEITEKMPQSPVARAARERLEGLGE